MSTAVDLSGLRELALGAGTGVASAKQPWLRLDSAEHDLPSASDLALLLSAAPVRGIRLVEPVDTARLPDLALARVIALLRESASIGVEVVWSLVLDTEHRDLIPRIDHLPTPESITVRGVGPLPLGEWRASRQFGLLHFRRGPGFLSVIDRRPESSSRIVLDDRATMEAFLRCLEPCSWQTLTSDPELAVPAGELLQERLTVRLGDSCVALPVHMRHWPIPALDV
jgi:Family of unknown function (DUF5825)